LAIINFRALTSVIYLSFFALVIVLVYYISNIDCSSNFAINSNCEINRVYDISSHIKKLSAINIHKEFPYDIYLDSSNYNNVEQLLHDISTLDSFIPLNHEINLEVLSTALTDKLNERYKNRFHEYSPDSILLIIQWAEKFHSYANIDRSNARLYESIYDNWIEFAIQRLDEYYYTDNSIKYNFKYKYLLERCRENKFNGSVGFTRFEKVINNIIEKKWRYLLNRFWIGTTIYCKLFAVIIIGLTTYSYYCIFKLHFRKS